MGAKLSHGISGNCSESVRYAGIVLCCHSEERSDEESTISPRRGRDTERGSFAIQLTETEQLLFRQAR